MGNIKCVNIGRGAKLCGEVESTIHNHGMRYHRGVKVTVKKGGRTQTVDRETMDAGSSGGHGPDRGPQRCIPKEMVQITKKGKGTYDVTFGVVGVEKGSGCLVPEEKVTTLNVSKRDVQQALGKIAKARADHIALTNQVRRFAKNYKRRAGSDVIAKAINYCDAKHTTKIKKTDRFGNVVKVDQRDWQKASKCSNELTSSAALDILRKVSKSYRKEEQALRKQPPPIL